MKRASTITRLTALAALGLCTLACADFSAEAPDADNDDPRQDPEPPEVPQAPDDLDYTSTPWSLANVSQSTGTISHDAQLALEGGHAVIAFSEPAATNYGDQDIHRAIRVGDDWEAHSLTAAATEQLAFPNVIGTGGVIWFAYTGDSSSEAADSDIWVRREPLGQPTGEAIDVTLHAPDPANPDLAPRSDTRSQLVASADGGVHVIYVSRPGLDDLEPNDIRVVTLSADGEAGAPTSVFSSAAYCTDLIAVGDGGGVVHAVADCGDLHYITNASGTWTSEPVPLGASRFPFSPDIALGPDGEVHLVWNGGVDCETGTCRRVHHSRALGEPVEVAVESGYMPEVAVDAGGRVLVVYHRTGDAPGVMLTHADDGVAFAPPRPIADTEDRDTSASHLQFDTNGWPHLLFERVISGSSPLDAEIIHATIR